MLTKAPLIIQVFNDVNINLSTKTADVGDWELRAKYNTKEQHARVSCGHGTSTFLLSKADPNLYHL
jgi:hypothetical protein